MLLSEHWGMQMSKSQNSFPSHSESKMHSTQSASLVITSSVGCIVVPPGHGSGAAEPSAQ